MIPETETAYRGVRPIDCGWTGNARIKSARLTTEDYGQLTLWLVLDYGDTEQGFGGWSLCPSPDSKHYPGNANFAGIYIWRVFQIAEVQDFAKLPGRTIRVRKDSKYGNVLAIGHILKDDWFDPNAEFAPFREEMVA
jgi:hypothetical protein